MPPLACPIHGFTAAAPRDDASILGAWAQAGRRAASGRATRYCLLAQETLAETGVLGQKHHTYRGLRVFAEVTD
jgi:hypothetical protein